LILPKAEMKIGEVEKAHAGAGMKFANSSTHLRIAIVLTACPERASAA
jgi:hypothetical protein